MSSAAGELDDLAQLAHLDEGILNNELQARYHSQRIYTYVGDILVAFNPYEELPLYGQDVAWRYKEVCGEGRRSKGGIGMCLEWGWGALRLRAGDIGRGC